MGFIDHNMNLLPDEEPFIRKLAENLIFYNTKRVHKGLGNMTPGGGIVSNVFDFYKGLTLIIIKL
jgi:transposase InsO family protein